MAYRPEYSSIQASERAPFREAENAGPLSPAELKRLLVLERKSARGRTVSENEEYEKLKSREDLEEEQEQKTGLTPAEWRRLLRLEELHRSDMDQDEIDEMERLREKADEGGEDDRADAEEALRAIKGMFRDAQYYDEAEFAKKHPDVKAIKLATGGNYSRDTVLILPDGSIEYMSVSKDYDVDKESYEQLSPEGAIDKLESSMVDDAKEIARLTQRKNAAEKAIGALKEKI